MIDSREKLKYILRLEFSNYFPSRSCFVRAFLLRERNFYVWSYQKSLRKLEYYKNTMGGAFRIYRQIMFAYYSRKVNKQGASLGIECWHSVFEQGLLIYHLAGGIVVNSSARIGKNCCLHGNNCIGNNGSNYEAPQIGDNCTIGVGAKVIGNIQLGNNIKIAAGAIVIKSCFEDNVTLAGIPAKIVKRK